MRYITILFAVVFMLIHASGNSQDNRSGNQKNSGKPQKRTNYQEQEEPEEQDSVKRFEYGLNFGAYFPNKYSANYYNGTPGNVNNVKYVMSNYYWYQDIYRALGASDTVMVQNNPYTGETGYPMNMHYSVSFSAGVFLRVNFDRKNGIFLEANYTNLKAEDVLVLEVDPPDYLTTPDLRYQPISGREGRVLIDFGYQRTFPMKSKTYFFAQAAVTMCYTQVIKSVFVVGGVEYNMINVYGNQYYIPNSNMQTYNINQNAFGFGGTIGVGAGIPLTHMFGLEPGFYMQYYPTNLEKFPDFKPSFGASLRLLLDFSPDPEE